MKPSTLFMLVTIFAYAASRKNCQDNKGHNLDDYLKDSNPKSIDELTDCREEISKNFLEVLRDVAIHLVDFTEIALESAWKLAKKTAENLVHSSVFDSAVNRLISMIDTSTTEAECVLVCEGAIIQHVQGIGTTLANALCPPVCHGALAKLQEATRQLANLIEGKAVTNILSSNDLPA